MMIRTPISNRRKLFLNILSVVVLLSAYSFLSYRQHQVNPEDNTIPSLTKIGSAVIQVISPHPRSGERWLVVDASATFFRLGVSFSLAVAASIVIGLAVGCFRSIEAVFEWPMSFAAKIIPTGALAVFFAIFGTDIKMFIAMIVFGILPAMTMSVVIAVKQMPQELINKGFTLGSSTTEMILSLVVRYILPNLIDAIKAGLGPAMIFLLAAEMLCADVGFGYRIRMQSRLNNMDVVYVYLITLALFGFLADFALKTIQHKVCPWYIKESK